MSRIDEQEIFAGFIGKKIFLNKLEAIARNNGKGYGAYADSTEYIIAHVDYCDVREFQELFGLTPTLIDRWGYKGIDFSVYLYAKDGTITGGHIFKYIETSMSCHYRPTGYTTNATQQEIRIVARILTYLTSEA